MQLPSLGSIAGAAGNTLKDNVGVIEKAIIEVIDLRYKDEPKKQDAPQVQKKNVSGIKGALSNDRAGTAMVNKGLFTGVVGDMKLSPYAGEYAKLVRDGIMNNDDVQRVKDSYVRIVENNMDQYLDRGRKYFTVQFNPSTLQLSGHAGGLVRRLSYEKEDRDKDGKEDHSASYAPGTTSIIMSVSLFFDASDPQNDFLDDKLTMNPTSVLTGGAKAVMTAMGNKKTSVQTEVEGFIGALRNPMTRIMTFNWGKICYSGVLRSVGVNYTMFSPNGNPVRANVDLSMVCADDDQWPHTLAVWQSRYAHDFSKGSESFVKTEQKMGSLLNF